MKVPIVGLEFGALYSPEAACKGPNSALQAGGLKAPRPASPTSILLGALPQKHDLRKNPCSNIRFLL